MYYVIAEFIFAEVHRFMFQWIALLNIGISRALFYNFFLLTFKSHTVLSTSSGFSF